jgi:predicted DNA-binding protein YlxM (UPF0122 family)
MYERKFTVAEIAEYFQVSRTLVYSWIKSGELRIRKRSLVSKRKEISLDSLRDFAKGRQIDISDLLDAKEE